MWVNSESTIPRLIIDPKSTHLPAPLPKGMALFLCQTNYIPLSTCLENVIEVYT